MLGQEEALVLVSYPDGEHRSIGAGHNDSALTPDSKITLEEALALLAVDLVSREAAVAKMLKVPIKQWEFDALVDAYYNKGNLVAPVIDLLNAGHTGDAMAHLLTINRNKAGVFLPGLAKRRFREMQLFLYGDYGDLTTIKVWRGPPSSTKPTIEPMPPSLAATVAAPTFG